MKKILLFCMMMVFCFSACGAFAEGTVDEFFACRAGSISFALPGYPQVFREVALPAKALEGTYLAWNSKVQLTGYGPEDGEFQVHIADITPAIDWLKEDRPGEDEEQYQLNALMTLVQFYLDIHSGSLVGEVMPKWQEIDGKMISQASFAYSYPDVPEVTYQGMGFVDGGLAVIMMVQADESNLAYLQDMKIATEEEAAAVPETVTVGRLQVTFPEAPLKNAAAGHWFYQAFTEDYGYLSLEHMKIDLSFMLEDGMTMEEFLPMMAEMTAQQYQAEGVIGEYEIKKLAEGMYAFVAMEEDLRYPEGHGPLGCHVMGVFAQEGVYTLSAVETEAGEAFYDSLTVVEK